MNFDDYKKVLQQEHTQHLKDLSVTQIASAYAVAKVLGYNKSIQDFETEFDKHYSLAINELEK